MFKIIHILSCWKEIVYFEYALFVEYAIFVKSLMVWCFGCHGNTNWDNSCVYIYLMLKIRSKLHNVYMNKQSNPLFNGDILLWKCLFFVKSRTIWWFGWHGNLYLNNIFIFIFWILLVWYRLAWMCINYPYFWLHKQDNLLWKWSIL